MKTILVIGAGQLGSRHLQALKLVKHDLKISVVDPFQASLDVAKERFEGFNAEGGEHTIEYFLSVDELKDTEFDVVISASSCDTRYNALTKLLGKANVKNFLLEKVLFNKKDDYSSFQKILKDKNINAYVNCSMRTMPFYRDIRNTFLNTDLQYIVSGSNYRLMSNIIHYVDHMVYLSGCTEFEVDCSLLDKKYITSKREGFWEFNGTLLVKFANGSSGMFTSYNGGDSPAVIYINNEKCKIVSRESEGKIWMQKSDDAWKWEEIDFRIPYQSEMTSKIVTDLLETGKCELVEYDESMNTHIQLYQPILEHFNKYNDNIDYYPFT